MKRNLLSIIILALLIVNIVLTAIMMFSVVGSARKTSALVTDIASVLKLELTGAGGEEEGIPPVSLKDTVTYNIAEMTIPLRVGEDGAAHFVVLVPAVSMNSKHADFKTYAPENSLAAYESQVQDVINQAFSAYTADEVRDVGEQEAIKKDILGRLKVLFESDFIYNVSFGKIIIS